MVGREMRDLRFSRILWAAGILVLLGLVATPIRRLGAGPRVLPVVGYGHPHVLETQDTSPSASPPECPAKPVPPLLELEIAPDIDEAGFHRLQAAALVPVGGRGPGKGLYLVPREAFALLDESHLITRWRAVSATEKAQIALWKDLETSSSMCVMVFPVPGVTYQRLKALISASGGADVGNRVEVGDWVTCRADLNAVKQLVESPEILHVARYPGQLVPARNDSAAELSRVNECRPGEPPGYNLTGAGIRILVLDDGHPSGHQDYTGRLTYIQPGEVGGDHSTSVIGTLISTGASDRRGRGMAPEAHVLAAQAVTMGAILGMLSEYGDRVDVVNNSQGFIRGWWTNRYGYRSWRGHPHDQETDWQFGKYTEIEKLLDESLESDNLIFIQSAGNESGDLASENPWHWHVYEFGPPDPMSGVFPSGTRNRYSDVHPADAYHALGGMDNLVGGAVAKNPIVVGAVDEQGRMARFSSVGPADDGRIKPDLVAKGESLWTTVYNQITEQTYYDQRSGTSFSAPVVSGSVALLIQHFRNQGYGESYRAPLSLMKAILTHTARDMREPGPDYVTGWGLLDTRAAADLIREDAVLGHWRRLQSNELRNGHAWTWGFFQSRTDVPLKFTLAWTDPAGSPNVGGLNDRSAALENNLELVVIDPKGRRCYPFVLDPRNPGRAARKAENAVDNVEQVLIERPIIGMYQVLVTHALPLKEGAPQRFALASSVDLGGTGIERQRPSPAQYSQHFWPDGK